MKVHVLAKKESINMVSYIDYNNQLISLRLAMYSNFVSFLKDDFGKFSAYNLC